jgi:hypothetical protein
MNDIFFFININLVNFRRKQKDSSTGVQGFQDKSYEKFSINLAQSTGRYKKIMNSNLNDEIKK